MLLRDFSLKAGKVYNPSLLKADIKRINDLEEFPFIDDEQDVEKLTDEEGGDIILRIKLVKRGS
jgi:outer membrane protein assembly factor BamA